MVDNSVVVALISLAGAVIVTVLGVVVTRILGTNREEMERLEEVEKRGFILQDYSHTLRDFGATMREQLIRAGQPTPPPLPPWPAELTGRQK